MDLFQATEMQGKDGDRMNKAFEDILKKLRTVAVERQGNTGIGGEPVVNLDDAQDNVQ